MVTWTGMTDAGRHRLCLVLALIGTLLMGATVLTTVWENAGFELPVFKASKPPIPEWAVKPPRGSGA